MIYLVFFAFCIFFIEACKRLSLFSHVAAGSQSLNACMATLTDAKADDLKKEAMARSSSLLIGKHTFLFVVKALVIALVLYLIAEATIRLGWLSSVDYQQSLLSWQMLLALTVFSIIYIKISKHAFSR